MIDTKICKVCKYTTSDPTELKTFHGRYCRKCHNDNYRTKNELRRKNCDAYMKEYMKEYNKAYQRYKYRAMVLEKTGKPANINTDIPDIDWRTIKVSNFKPKSIST